MKKSLLPEARAALVAIAVSVFVYVNNGKDEMDDLFYANVEVLAGDEGGENDGALWSNAAGTVYCCGPGNVRNCNDTFVPKC